MGKRGPKPQPIDGPKLCHQCCTLKERTEEFWHRNGRNRDGLSDACRECRSRLRKKEPAPKVIPLTKVCPRCKTEKPLTPEFWWRHRSEASGFQAYCKTCQYTPTGGKGGKKNPFAAEGMKVCPKCNSKKPLTSEHWFRDKSAPDGFQGWCKLCNTTVTNAAKLRQRVLVLEHYSGGEPKCSCCGDTRLVALNLDHISGGGSKHRRELTAGIYSWLIQNNFPEGYRVLCRNCDWIWRMQGRCEH